ncbi:transglutaminaseTgpA domain-containing protein [Streptomyces sp. NPDC046203]|uniref:transglutaminaseTgpA domain-containing protein n=1 Tax=Streptomyces sp. NPDC046203 TaxID=3154602 RepID=UPI003410AD2D
MSGRGRLTLAAYGATMAASAALLPLVKPATWIFTAAFVVGLQSLVGALTRRVPLARPLTIGAQLLVTVLALTLLFARAEAFGWLVPGPDAVRAFARLFEEGVNDVGTYAPPAPSTAGIRLLLVSGVAVIGLLVDTLAVTFRGAAPAGLPLLALYSVAAGLSGGDAGWLFFPLAAAGYLLLLLAEGRDRLSRWGRVFGGAQRPGRPGAAAGDGGSVSAPARTGRRIGAVALGVSLVVPLVLPGLSGGFLGGPGSGPGSGGGKGGTISAVNPLVSLQNNLRQPEDREVLRYRTNAVDNSGLYLRLVALDQFDGTSWKSSVRPVQDLPGTLPRPIGLSQNVDTGETTTNLVASTAYEQKWLPMPFPASRVSIDGSWRYEPAGRMLVGDNGQSTKGARYTVTSLDVRPTAGQLAAAPAAPAELRREYTRVPSSLPADVHETALRVTSGARDDYERAVKLQNWFASEGGFRYDVNVASGTGVHAISRFLKDKEGFCVHFSFSMAAMARSLGIPARVAVGFMPGTPQPDGSVSVGIRDAHAWPELYFEGVGWARFEPTPSRGSTPAYTREQSSGDTAAPSAPPSAGPSDEPSAAPSDAAGCTAQAKHQGDCGPDQAVGAAAFDDGGMPLSRIVWLAVGIVLVLTLPLLPLLWRTRVRARRLGPSGGVLAVWREINDTAWDHGVAPDESRTPRATAERLVRLGELPEDAAEAVHRAAGAVEELLYAPRPRPADGLAKQARIVRNGFRLAASRRVRLRALLAPRSAVRVVWATRDRAEKVREAVRAAVPSVGAGQWLRTRLSGARARGKAS